MQLLKSILFLSLSGMVSLAYADERNIYGLYEKVKVMDLNGAIISAKLDTGAVTASLNATDIEIFKRDGEDWVRFTPQTKTRKYTPMELPIVRISKIKRRAADVDDEDENDEINLYGVIVPTNLNTDTIKAENTKIFKRKNKKWVRFTPVSEGKKGDTIERPLVKLGSVKKETVEVKDNNNEEENLTTPRPVVEMQVCIGSTLKTIEVNLTDRSAFRYPLLIGSNVLKDFNIAVDPSLKHQQKPNCRTNKNNDKSVKE